MKTTKIFSVALLVASIALATAFHPKETDPWKPEQLLAPSELAATINNPNAIQPIILNIGPAGHIKNSIKIGATREKENLDAMKKLLAKEPKHRVIVLYCGCCPFQNCPNIRPAFSLLNDMKFTNHKLLNLTKNLKVDWIDHGYPMAERNQ